MFQLPTAPCDLFKFLVSSNQRSKSKIALWPQKATNHHIVEPWTNKCLSVLLEMSAVMKVVAEWYCVDANFLFIIQIKQLLQLKFSSWGGKKNKMERLRITGLRVFKAAITVKILIFLTLSFLHVVCCWLRSIFVFPGVLWPHKDPVAWWRCAGVLGKV